MMELVGIKNKVTLWFLIVPDLTLIFFFFTTTNLLICWLIKTQSGTQAESSY